MRVPTLADLFRTDTNSHLLDSAPLSNVSDWSSLTDAEFKVRLVLVSFGADRAV